MVTILQPINQARAELSGESYPTLPMVIPVISNMKTLLENYIRTTGEESVLTFAKQLLRAFKAHFPTSGKMKPNALAMILNPKFKAILLSEDEVKLAISILEREIYKHVPEPQSQVAVQENSDLSCSPWSSFDKYAKMNRPTENKQHVKDQISKYLMEPYVWWKDNNW